MIDIPLGEEIPTKEVYCLICGEILKAHFVWWGGAWRHSTVHEACLQRWQACKRNGTAESLVPEQFRNFDPSLFPYKDSLQAAQSFEPDSPKRILCIAGLAGRGKTRLCWAVISQFCTLLRERGQSGKIDYLLFASVIADLDRGMLQRIKTSKYLFLDDIGAVECFGRERATVQAHIRSRVQTGVFWTFMTVDHWDFDDELPRLLKDRALIISIKS